jgi:hypothetical protein
MGLSNLRPRKKVLAYDTYHLHVDLDKGALYIESEFSTSLNLLDVLKQVLHASGDDSTLLIGKRLIGSHHGVSLPRSSLPIGENRPVEPINDPVDYWYRHLVKNALLLYPGLQKRVELLEGTLLPGVLPDLHHAPVAVKHVNPAILPLLIWVWRAKSMVIMLLFSLT